MLLTHVLAELGPNPSTDDIRNAMYAIDVMVGEGLMGEGLRLSDISGSNERALLVIQQNQNGQFCTASPSALATCPAIEDFLSWRDRAVIQDTQGCTEPWPDPDL